MQLNLEDVESLECEVSKATVDGLKLGGVETVDQSKLLMGFELDISVKYEKAGIASFSEETLRQKDLLEFEDYDDYDSIG